MQNLKIKEFIKLAIEEDVQNGDHTSMACIPSFQTGEAKLLIKENGIIAGVSLAEMIFNEIDSDLRFSKLAHDGSAVKKGDVAFIIAGNEQSILKSERLILNCMQRMSGIATMTAGYVEKIKDLPVKILDTRKTTPLFRHFEKWAVRIGGGYNHRMGLYDMIMIKDNHIEYAGGIERAIRSAQKYLSEKKLDLKIEIETRNMEEVKEVIALGGVERIMFDNFRFSQLREAVHLVNKKFETEASGGITLETLRDYAFPELILFQWVR